MTDAERWYRERYAATPERDALFTTVSGEPVQPLYTAHDLPEADPARTWLEVCCQNSHKQYLVSFRVLQRKRCLQQREPWPHACEAV